MVYVPDTSAASLAYLFARAKIKGEDLPTWDQVFNQTFLFLIDSAATLVINSGTTSAPNGTVAASILSANIAVGLGTRNF